MSDPKMLSDEQCGEFRRLPCSFNDMVRNIHAAGYQARQPEIESLSAALVEKDQENDALKLEAMCFLESVVYGCNDINDYADIAKYGNRLRDLLPEKESDPNMPRLSASSMQTASKAHDAAIWNEAADKIEKKAKEYALFHGLIGADLYADGCYDAMMEDVNDLRQRAKELRDG